MKHYKELFSAYPPNYGVKPEHVWLAERAVIDHDGNWLVRSKGGVWQMMKAKAARLSLTQHWCGQAPFHISEEDVEKYMDHKPPVVCGMMLVPSSDAPLTEMNDRLFVNTWRNTIVQPDATALADPALRSPLTLLMRMIRENLSGRDDPRTLDEMLILTNSTDPAELEFRFLMSWCAAPIKEPGRNLQTNLWLMGAQQGIGKGTFFEILKRIYSGAHVAILNAQEIEQGGWTDALEGRLLVVINELKAGGRFNWDTFIKQHSCETIIPIRKRNHHGYEVLNHCNWMFTTNDEQPSCLDAQDRRNCLIATTRDATKAKLAVELNEWMARHPDQVSRLLGAFVAILHRQQIDQSLISRAPDTLIKQDVREGRSSEHEELYWLRNDDHYQRDTWLRAYDLLADYCRFTRDSRATPRTMGLALGKLARHGFIQRRRHYETGPWEYLIPSSDFPNHQNHVTTQQPTTSPETALRLVPASRW